MAERTIGAIRAAPNPVAVERNTASSVPHIRCTLNTGTIPVADDAVYQYDSIYDFPSIGSEGRIYAVREPANKLYRWSNTEKKYYCCGSNYEDIHIISGGNSIR